MKTKRFEIPRLLAHGVIAVALALCIAAPARATSVLPLYLEEIVDTATVAFEGTVMENRTELDKATNLVVTYTTFSVREVLKGTVGTTYTIKQVGGRLPGAEETVRFTIRGVPTFGVGGDYVVFLAGVSSAGFSSPIGLSQGRFGVKDDAGVRKVANGRDFKEMTARIAQRVPQHAREAMSSAAGPALDMDVVDFKQLVRTHLGAKK